MFLLIDKVRDCSFRLHTLLFPTHLGPLDLYLDSHRSIGNTHGSPLHYRNSSGCTWVSCNGIFSWLFLE
jgi:hypothetical protein